MTKKIRRYIFRKYFLGVHFIQGHVLDVFQFDLMNWLLVFNVAHFID
jgi:hypothetical protein